MRINRFIAQATGMSRRSADQAIADGRVTVNGVAPTPGQAINPTDIVLVDAQRVQPQRTITIMLHKPVGYVCSREGQGNDTIYALLPSELHSLKPIGRLDKHSSGLLLLTNDGILAQMLTHPSKQKSKVYQVQLATALTPKDQQAIQAGIMLDDGPSKLGLKLLDEQRRRWEVRMSEGRNRQIRRTFEALDYHVTALHRSSFGPYKLGDLRVAKYTIL